MRAEHANSDGELSATSLPALLGDYRGAVLAKGLAVLPADRLRALLRQPLLLLELQRLVFVQGGDYWEQVGPASSELEGMVSEARERLQSQLPDEPRRDSWFPLSWNRWASIASLLRPVTAGLAAAAAILLVVVMYQHYNVSTGPGGNEEVAEARQREAVALATHIAEYRRACSAFIMSGPKRPAPTSRDRYRVLAGNLDGQLRAVEAGRDASAVRAEAKKTFNELTETAVAEYGRPRGLDTGDPKQLLLLAGQGDNALDLKWGWNKPDALDQSLPAKAYLNRLADGASEWFAEHRAMPPHWPSESSNSALVARASASARTSRCRRALVAGWSRPAASPTPSWKRYSTRSKPAGNQPRSSRRSTTRSPGLPTNSARAKN